MPGEKPGEYIALSWDGTPDALFVRGHVPVDDAIAEIERHHDGDIVYEPLVKAWARWSCESNRFYGRVLRDYDAPGRGRFPVMRAEVVKVHVDPNSWRTRRDGARWDWRTSAMVSNTRPGEECDCDDWSAKRCACDGGCACHWFPRRGSWWKVGDGGGDSQIVALADVVTP